MNQAHTGLPAVRRSGALLALVLLSVATILSLLPTPQRSVAASDGSPSIQLGVPEISGRSVVVNGVTLPAKNATITRIFWNWGDNTGNDSWFPASHTYVQPGNYMVTVTSYQDDGLWASASRLVYIASRSPFRVFTPLTARDEFPPQLQPPAAPSEVAATVVAHDEVACIVTVDVAWKDNASNETGFLIGPPTSPQVWPEFPGFIRVPVDATAARFTVHGGGLFPVFVFAMRHEGGAVVFSDAGPAGVSGVFLQLPDCIGHPSSTG